jgi:hypothetical protein
VSGGLLATVARIACLHPGRAHCGHVHRRPQAGAAAGHLRPGRRAELERGARPSGCFGPASFRRYQWDQPYSTDGYLDLLPTYSGHRALDRPARDRLLACIARLIEDAHGGTITKRYLTELRIAHRLAG